MHNAFRISSVVLALGLVACSAASAEEPVAGPPPSEPVVFAASAETKADVGIAKWGFASDPAKGTTLFRGYDERNAILAEIVQTLDQSDPNNVHFVMTMSGPKATASEKIDFSARPSDDGQNTVLSMNVIENTFDEGSVASHVLTHFSADSKAATAPGSMTSGSGSLVGQSHPLDGQQLVTTCNQAVNRCETELIDSRIAAAGAANDCSLVRKYGYPLVTTIGGALIGGFFTLETGPGAIVGAAAGGAGGALNFPIAAHQCASSQADAAKAQQALRDCQQKASAQGCN